jgi:NAD(P)-dependent dehydrogenase (short-subunit alcohol dehydrogenase family)
MDELTGRVAVVTGGASGIGLAMAKRFAAAGMKVVLGDIEPGALDKAVAGLQESGAEAVGTVTDVSDYAQVEALRDRALDAFGAVHVVCNNAGVGGGGQMWECSLEDWRWVLGVNLWGVIHGVKAFVPLLVEQGEGHVVNTASMAGLTSPAFMGPYNVSKHGVVTLSETLYAELAAAAPGVGVSVVCPGWVKTNIDTSSRNRPDALANPVTPAAEEQDGAVASVLHDLIANGLPPERVADLVHDALVERRFYVLTHPDWSPMISGRVERIVGGQNPEAGFLPT